MPPRRSKKTKPRAEAKQVPEKIGNAKKRGKMALADAIWSNDGEYVEELLAAKADPCARVKHGMSGLHVACEKGKVELVKKLLAAGGTKGIDDIYRKVDEEDDDDYAEWTALLASSERGDLPIVETLIKAKADVTICQDGMSAASFAAKKGHPAVLEALVKAGVDVLHKNENGASLVFLASQSAECVRVLIEAKACVLTLDEGGWSPLTIAALHGCVEAMRLLIEAKADANTPNDNGDTALHRAAFYSQDEAIKVLVFEGQARLDIKNNHGQTPLQWARAGSSTHALLSEMELTGADEHVLVKGAAKRFKPMDQ